MAKETKMEQIRFGVPKDKKETRVTIMLNYADLKALNAGMNKVGETNMSSYIRRLIHEHKGF